jgi:TolB-like protein
MTRIIRRCLEKDPRYRVQTTRDVSNEFRDLTRTRGWATSIPSSDMPAVPTTKTDSGSARADHGFWVAVLPFRYQGNETALQAFAEGLTEEIITGLSRFSYLRVIGRGSTAKHSREGGDVREIGKALGARYVMEGNVRQSGSAIRLAVQLVDTATGAHLWAETFEQAFRAEETFALQDQFVPRIVSTVADQHGVLTRSIAAAIRKRVTSH